MPEEPSKAKNREVRLTRLGFAVDSLGVVEPITEPAFIGDHDLPSDRRRGPAKIIMGDFAVQTNKNGQLYTFKNERQFYIDPTGKRVYDIDEDSWHEVGKDEDSKAVIDRLNTPQES